MAVADKSGKEFFRLLNKNVSPSKNLYKIFYKNTIELSYRCMHNIANLINKSNNKMLKNKQNIGLPKCNFINKAVRENADMNA